jgi:hypothetical protein
MNRRDFLKTSAIAGGSLALANNGSLAAASPSHKDSGPKVVMLSTRPGLPNLSPAQWIWYPSGRTLQNTFVLFRRELLLTAKPRRATGWISADSRYRLELNGQRVQWGPAPSDPRWAEADPLDLTGYLEPGHNVIGVTVLFYGTGDGTWGSPGSCSGWRSSKQMATLTESFPTAGGRPWSAGLGGQVGPSAGTFGHCRKSSIRVSTRMDGLGLASRQMRNGSRRCPWLGRRTNPLSPQTTTNTRSM